jgi:hypothetical protein
MTSAPAPIAAPVMHADMLTRDTNREDGEPAIDHRVIVSGG